MTSRVQPRLRGSSRGRYPKTYLQYPYQDGRTVSFRHFCGAGQPPLPGVDTSTFVKENGGVSLMSPIQTGGTRAAYRKHEKVVRSLEGSTKVTSHKKMSPYGCGHCESSQQTGSQRDSPKYDTRPGRC